MVWLTLTIAADLLYCMVKYLEYLWNVEQGISTRTNMVVFSAGMMAVFVITQRT